uniref:hypothetical protein n=1 Tax=Nocardia alni TaxID=2815723 RepID=UPI0020B2E576
RPTGSPPPGRPLSVPGTVPGTMYRVPIRHLVPPPGRIRPRDASTDADMSMLDRRALLRVAGGGAFAIATLSAAACAPDQPKQPDSLLPHEVSARTDAVWAQAAAAAAPDKAAALTVIATQRTAHADALRAEINRAIGVYGDGTLPKSPTPQVVPPPAPNPPPTAAAVHDRLTAAQKSAAAGAAADSAYRAGLLASISASCASQAGVLIPS